MKTFPALLALGALLSACGGEGPAPVVGVTTAASVGELAQSPSSDVPVANAATVVAGLRPAFRKCYDDGLAKDPKIEGKVLVVAKIDAKGIVTSTGTEGTTTLPTDVVTCLSARLQKEAFDPPGGTGSTLKVPISFRAAP